MKNYLSLFFLICSLLYVGEQAIPNQNIVIGIFTQQYWYADHHPISDLSTLTYITPSYVNIASMVGAKVVPIYSYTSKRQILKQLKKVNGIIFTGGEQYISITNIWVKNAKVVLDYAIQQNDNGVLFPILGICQGLQLMLYLTSDMRQDFLDPIYGQNGVWNTIKFVNKDYYLLDGVSKQTFEALTVPNQTKQNGPVYLYHSNGTYLQTFQNDNDLNSFWNLIAYSQRGDQKYVTYLQSKKYPFYLVQFHPERLTYKSSYSQRLFQARNDIIHTISQNFIIKCRLNPHTYDKKQLSNQMIDNFPMYDSIRFPDTKIYLFNEYRNIAFSKANLLHEQGFQVKQNFSWNNAYLIMLECTFLILLFILILLIRQKKNNNRIRIQRENNNKITQQDQKNSQKIKIQDFSNRFRNQNLEKINQDNQQIQKQWPYYKTQYLNIANQASPENQSSLTNRL